MTSRIFKSICTVAMAVFLSTLVLIMNLLYNYFSRQQLEQLEQQAFLVAQGVSLQGMDYFDGLELNDNRVTLIGSDGMVLYDSRGNADEMGNHMAREEVKQAMTEGVGTSMRYSTTLTERMMYAAVRTENGSVVRISDQQYTILTLLLSIAQPMAVVIVIGLILSLVLASGISKRIVRPLNELGWGNAEKRAVYPELEPLMERLRRQTNELKIQRDAFRRKVNEFDAIAGQMREGMVLLGEACEVLAINNAAKRIFGLSEYCVGKLLDMIEYSSELQEAVLGARQGGNAEKRIQIGHVDYQVNVSPVIGDNSVIGVVMLVFDITEREKTEKLRREFTANVSHELKTPLHTVAGYAELLAEGMVQEKDIPGFSRQILSEAQRMTVLVDDIIRLSHMDEGTIALQYENVDLYKMALQSANELRAQAEESEISLTVSGSAAVVYGVPQLLELIIHNLADNAIKYNRKGGSVNVNIERDTNEVLLTVSDTGIGIGEEHRERVFERFYRVSKARSRAGGGTGLGLSIVKHAVRLNHGRISLQSEIDRGTVITVAFPKGNT